MQKLTRGHLAVSVQSCVDGDEIDVIPALVDAEVESLPPVFAHSLNVVQLDLVVLV